MKPIIALLPNLYENECSISYDSYIDAIRRAGGIPVILPIPESKEDIPKALSAADGLVIPGGQDLNPKLYKKEPHPTVTNVSDERDSFEFDIIDSAIKLDMPILAICRGLQIINVFLGGTLIQDIPSLTSGGIAHVKKTENGNDKAYRHNVFPCGDSVKAPIKIPRTVNSFHHQSIENVGKGLIPIIKAEDGTIEAVYSENPFIIGVQWHPERMTSDEEYDGGIGIFKALIDSAAKR